jgi:hypothetical protein
VTVREMVKDIQDEMRDTDLMPTRASQLLAKATALMGNCMAEIREADFAYATVLLSIMETEKTVAKAKIRAEVTPEYLRRQEARDTHKLVDEMSKSLKYVQRAAEAEMRL